MPQSRAHIRATTKFESKAYEKLSIRLRKDRPDESGLSRESITAAAAAAGESINVYVLTAIKQRMDREK